MQLATESPGSSHSHVGLLVFSLSCDFVFSCFVCSPCLCVRPFAARRFKQVLDTHDTPHDCHDASINVSRWRVIFVVLVVLLFILVFVFVLQLASVYYRTRFLASITVTVVAGEYYYSY